MASGEEEERDGASVVYKMKVVQFLDRSVPIILQNDNGPCPLLAISNVLLLRNNVTLGIDMLEISQRDLMSLVAEWLLDANSNVQNKDDEFVKNQQQNIGDAIQLLPRLATGIDVNVRFRQVKVPIDKGRLAVKWVNENEYLFLRLIHDFEYTPECAIFDLFHVGLVHGWLCDPQDEVTFKCIGSNSYNTLVEKLVALHAIKAEQASQSAAIDDVQPVDFIAATIAALGVPTPHMKIVSDEEFEAMNQEAAAAGKARRKGDEEEAAELLQALKLSQTGQECTFQSSQTDHEGVLQTSSGRDILTSSARSDSGPIVEDGIPHVELTSTVHADKVGVESVELENETVTLGPGDVNRPSTDEFVPGVSLTSSVHLRKNEFQPVAEEVLDQDFVFTAPQTAKKVSKEVTDENELPSLRMWLKPAAGGVDTSGTKLLSAISEGSSGSPSGRSESPSPRRVDHGTDKIGNEGSGSIFAVGEEVKATVDPLDFDSRDVEDQNLSTSGSVGSSFEHVPSKDDKLSIGTGSGHLSEEVEDCTSSVLDEDEPLYEGEQRLVEPGIMSVANKEPLYEGEDISAESTDGQASGQGSDRGKNQELADENRSIAMTEGLIIENFLSSTASQLTYHGLFSLQDGLKNNELYVFFRNNHFSTLFKYHGQIYLLATDQGYLAQPDLVWEKLTEVDGDTVFATGTFDQFAVVQNSGGTWNERDAVAATADYLSTQQVSGANTEGAVYNSDLQLAMALQQQEIQRQKELQQQQHLQQQARSQASTPRPNQPSSKTPTLGAGGLVTGSSGTTAPPAKQEKAKEKCTIM